MEGEQERESKQEKGVGGRKARIGGGGSREGDRKENRKQE